LLSPFALRNSPESGGIGSTNSEREKAGPETNKSIPQEHEAERKTSAIDWNDRKLALGTRSILLHPAPNSSAMKWIAFPGNRSQVDSLLFVGQTLYATIRGV
jgi:hypothetical protein